MRIRVQWTRLDPQSWEDISTADWAATLSKDDPTGRGLGDPDDNRPGWVHALNVQGVLFNGYDHYAVEDLPDGKCRVTCWVDDPNTGPRNACRWTFEPLQPNWYGAYDTKQTVERFAEDTDILAKLRGQNALSSAGPVVVRPWSEFVKPPESATRHGKGCTDPKHADHESLQTYCSYYESIDGLPSEEIDSATGNLRNQGDLGREPPPVGTTQYYWTNTTVTSTVHTFNLADQFLMTENGDAGADGTTTSGNYGAGAQHTETAFYTPEGEPGLGTWTSGLYESQIDVTTAGSEMSYGFRNTSVDADPGHVGARVNSALSTEVGSVQQTQALFTGTGQKLGSANWTPGGTLTSDRLETSLAGERATGGHGNQSFTWNHNVTTSWSRAPWTLESSSSSTSSLSSSSLSSSSPSSLSSLSSLSSSISSLSSLSSISSLSSLSSSSPSSLSSLSSSSTSSLSSLSSLSSTSSSQTLVAPDSSSLSSASSSTLSSSSSTSLSSASSFSSSTLSSSSSSVIPDGGAATPTVLIAGEDGGLRYQFQSVILQLK